MDEYLHFNKSIIYRDSLYISNNLCSVEKWLQGSILAQEEKHCCKLSEFIHLNQAQDSKTDLVRSRQTLALQAKIGFRHFIDIHRNVLCLLPPLIPQTVPGLKQSCFIAAHKATARARAGGLAGLLAFVQRELKLMEALMFEIYKAAFKCAGKLMIINFGACSKIFAKVWEVVG